MVDNAWLHMEMPTNLIMVGSLVFFDAAFDREQLLATLRKRLLNHPRFVQRIEASPAGRCFRSNDDGGVRCMPEFRIPGVGGEDTERVNATLAPWWVSYSPVERRVHERGAASRTTTGAQPPRVRADDQG